MVEDRARPLGRLGIGDRGADHRVEHQLAEAFLQRRQGLARVDGAHVGEVEQHAEDRQLRVEAVAHELDHLHRLLDALQREVLRLGGDQRAVGGDQRVDRQQSQRRWAVDQDHVVVRARLRQRAPERQLASHLAAEHQLRLGEAEVGGDDVVVDRLGSGGASRRARRRSSARPRAEGRSSPTGCPEGRGRRPACVHRCAAGRPSAYGPRSSCRFLPSARAQRSSWPLSQRYYAEELIGCWLRRRRWRAWGRRRELAQPMLCSEVVSVSVGRVFGSAATLIKASR